MIIRRRFLLVWAIVIPLFCLNYVSVKGQNIGTQVNNALDYMFEDMTLSKSRIPTGYLLDRACELTNLRAYDGAAITNDNFSDVSSFRNALYTINSAIVNSNGAAYDADTITDQLADTTQVKIGAALFKYNYIVDNALTDNLISYQNGKVGDVTVNGILQNPFSEAKFFIFTPGRSIFKGSEIIRYTFSRSALLGNITLGDNDIIEFDPGDGDGYRLVDPSLDITVDYYSSGIKELKMRITFSDNTTVIGHSKIVIESPSITPLSAPLTIPTGSFIKFDNTNDSGLISARVTYKSSHGGEIVRPFIYVEGFDDRLLSALNSFLKDFDSAKEIKCLKDIAEVVKNSALLNNVISFLPGEFDFNWLYDQSLINAIKDRYDVFYVNINNPRASIADNATLQIRVINTINQMKSTSGCRNVIVGHSMGGLIARYALRYMETQNQKHQTDYYISLDSPHLGVNVPVSVQYALNDIYELFHSLHPLNLHLFDTVFAYLYKTYYSPSAKQMMYYFIDPYVGITSTYHDAWQTTINSLGFPQGDAGYPIENIAIANGLNNTWNNSDLFNLDISVNDIDSSFLTELILSQVISASAITLTMQGKRDDGSGGVVLDSRCSYKKPCPWLSSDITIQLFGDANNNYSRKHYAPNSAGFDLMSSSVILDDNYDFTSLNIDGLGGNYYPPICFVPVGSALADNYYSRDYESNPPKPVVDIPFSSYIIGSDSLSHTAHIEHWENIDSYINTTMTGPKSIVLDGDIFGVCDSTWFPSSHARWESSDSSIAVIDSLSGVLTVNSLGLVTITYSNYASDSAHRFKVSKRQQVLTGIPSDFHLSNQQSGTYFQFTASCSNDIINSFIDSAAISGRLSLFWGIKVGNNPIEWMETNSRTFSTSLSSTSTVYFKIVDELNRQHLLLFDTVFSSSPLTNYDPIMIYTVFGNAIMYYNTIHDDGVQENYLYLWSQLSQSYPLPPDRIIIDNQTIMRDVILTETVNGNQKSVYCFKILTSTYVQSVISNIDNYPNKTAIVTGAAYSGNDFLQNFTVTITKGFPPLP